MINTVYATKQKMTQTFSSESKRQVATVLNLPEHRFVRLITPEKSGYSAVQLALGHKTKPANMPDAGQLKVAKIEYQPQWIREVDGDVAELTPGSEIDLNLILGIGDTITVSSVSKGKGFAGVVKRYHFAGGPKTHGQSDRHRAPGSIGQRTTPGRIYKGKHMAGRMGSDLVTIKNLKVLAFDAAKKQILVSGPIPGSTGTLVKIQVIKKAPVKETVAEVTEQINE
jgi:large subunit ribosomal protein L3